MPCLNKPGEKSTEDPVMYMEGGKPVTNGEVRSAFRIGDMQDKIPGMAVAKGKLAVYTEQLLRTINPEGLGKEAKMAAATLAKNISIQVQKASHEWEKSAGRRSFWNQRVAEGWDFIKNFEKGKTFSDPSLNTARQGYVQWADRLYKQDQRNGIEYEPEEHYLYHVFKPKPGENVTDFLSRRFGNKWNDPKFVKDRSFDMYETALREGGFEPLYTNPEDIMLARQHAGDIAEMRVNTLKELEANGLAVRVPKGKGTMPERPKDYPSRLWRSPNGDNFWVHDKADAVLHNHFETKSLWADKGMVGDAFRGLMHLKNTTVQVRLSASLYHPLHVLGMDSSATLTRLSKELWANPTPANLTKWIVGVPKALSFVESVTTNPYKGWQIMKAYDKGLDDATLGQKDRMLLGFMNDGGFVPKMSEQYRSSAAGNFRDAWEKHSISAVWKAPFAAIDAISGVIFKKWIPWLKTASYTKDIQTALRVNPKLLEDSMARQLAFRKIAKSVDNRYGEMSYDTLFMNRMVKDLAVLNTLSMGWQLGFLREYGGGMMDLGQSLTSKGGVMSKVAAGQLDRPMFVLFYTTQALALGGLMTWAMTGKPPSDPLDYTFPKNGEKDAQGKDKRVTTMYYPKEFVAIHKRIQTEGVASGLGELAMNKASGVVGLISEWARGVNNYGQEIRDPNAPAFKQLEQTVRNTLIDLEPISIAAMQKGDTKPSTKTKTMDALGFGPAPRYITETGTESAIRSDWTKYVKPSLTPYDQVQMSTDKNDLRKAYNEGPRGEAAYQAKLNQMIEKFGLTDKDIAKVEKSFDRPDKDPLAYMFSRLPWRQQKVLLDKMTKLEREQYLPHSNKDHLRYHYDPPEGDR